MSLSNKTPEFNGSMQYIEICGDLQKEFHNCMVLRQYKTAVDVLQQLHSEILPWMDEEDVKKCSEYEKKCITDSSDFRHKGNINISNINNWFRKLNLIYHQSGLGMKSKKVDDNAWEL